jgi:hypothetical protein
MMNKVSGLRVMAAAVLGATLAMSAYAGEGAKKGSEPMSVDESRPDQAGKEPKGKASTSTMPSRGPMSVDDTTGTRRGNPKGVSKDDTKMANPRTPASVDESKPDRTGKGTGVRREAKKDKDKDATAAK